MWKKADTKNTFHKANEKLTINWWHMNKTPSLQGSSETGEEYEKCLYGLISKEKSEHQVDSPEEKSIQKHNQTRNQEKQQISNSNDLHLQNKHNQQ